MDYLTSTGKSIEEAFKEFHEKNPKIYDLFKKFSLQLVLNGKKKIGGRLIFERIRWEVHVTTTGDDEFKLNNNFAPHYTRLFIKDFPQHENLFNIRQLKAKKRPKPGEQTSMHF